MRDADTEGYRSFARGGLTAVITVNSGALVALVSQLSNLKDVSNENLLKAAFFCWVVGIVCGLLAWAAAATAAHSYAINSFSKEVWYSTAGLVCFFSSIICFIVGIWAAFQAVL